MKILFLTLVDFVTVDIHSLYTDLLREFIRNSHTIYAVSPTERKNKKVTHLIIGASWSILKVKIGNIQKTNSIEKGFSTLLLEHQVLSAIKKHFKDVKFDLVIYSTPPITLIKTIEYIRKRDKAGTYLLLKDIFPQNAVDLEMLKRGGLLHKYFLKKEKKLYRISDYIGCMSPRNVEFLMNHNNELDKSKVEVCPNSISPQYIYKNEVFRIEIRKSYNIPADKTVFLYGGNLGLPQGVDFIINCLRHNELCNNTFFLIVGAGTEFKKLELYFTLERPKNALLLGILPQNDFEVLCSVCDIGMVFLDKRFTIPNFPSRILSYMQAAIPVICATDKSSDVGEIATRNGFGFYCESGDISAFDEIISTISENRNLIGEMGEKSYSYLLENYTSKRSYEIIIQHFI